MAISLGLIGEISVAKNRLCFRSYLLILMCLISIAGTFSLFYLQNIKNGMLYGGICISIFLFTLFISTCLRLALRKVAFMFFIVALLLVVLPAHIHKNQPLSAFIADAKVAVQVEKYQHWKYAGSQGYPENEFGAEVSMSTYDRVAWFKVGSAIAWDNPLGYGLIEDSFKHLVKDRWPEASPNLSHSHSGWLDLILATGFPGFLCVMISLIISMKLSVQVRHPWGKLVFCSLWANLLLWCSTEVCATVTFAALIFWVCLSSGFTLIKRG
jgi:O-antigen ligase